jgi:hypothetical protein
MANFSQFCDNLLCFDWYYLGAVAAGFWRLRQSRLWNLGNMGNNRSSTSGAGLGLTGAAHHREQVSMGTKVIAQQRWNTLVTPAAQMVMHSPLL